MVAQINTVAFQGVDVLDVDVQVQISNGLPAFTIVGLPDKAVGESRERVRAALHAIGLALPPKRFTVNLAPADLNKEGSHFDLPIALGVLAAMEVIDADALTRFVCLGELSLDGSLRKVAGVLPSAMHAQGKDFGLIVPAECGAEAAWAGDLDIIAPRDLLMLINHLKGAQVLARPEARLRAKPKFKGPDMADVKGQETAKRALEIAASGGHNLLMCGPPGSGKSMLASCLPALLPDLTPREALEVSMIYSLSGQLPEEGLVSARPYRDPHHSASLPALIGGGQKAKPGEISLAHHGVLFLDELPEFQRGTLESLRQPVETGEVLVSRVNTHAKYPANIQLVGAMNPCKCGHMGDPELECTRAPRCGADYQSKISGPLFDRIDLVVDVPPVSVMDLQSAERGEDSATIAARVKSCRARQAARATEMGLSALTNAQLSSADLEKCAVLDEKAKDLLAQAVSKMKLSARAYTRVLKLARTIADMAGAPEVLGVAHISEALSYKRHMPKR